MDLKDSQWFQSQIDQYSNCRDHKRNLVEFLNELKNLDAEVRRKVLPKLNFEPMFLVLIKWNNPVFAGPFLELVNLVFNNMKACRIIINIDEDLLLKFYGHVNKDFKVAVFNLLNRAIKEGEAACFTKVPNLMYDLVQSLADESDNDSPIMQLLEKLIDLNGGAEIVFGSEVGEWLSEMCEVSEVKFEIFELALKVACESEENMLMVKSSHILDELEKCIQGARAHVDQSGFAAAVECYTRLGVTPWGYQELFTSGVLSKLEARVVDYGPGTMEDKVMPAVYKFFGKIFHAFPEKAALNCPKVVPTVLKLISDESLDRAYVTRTEIEMIGMISVKPDGKRYLASLGPSFKPVLLQLEQFVLSSSSCDKICALETLMDLVVVEDEEQDDDVLNLIKSWFETIFSSVKELIKFCQEPFPGVKRTTIPIFVSETEQCRNAGLKLLLLLTNLSWARQEICRQPELVDWIMEGEDSRDVHFCSAGAPNEQVLQLKSDIARTILKDKKLKPETKKKLQMFVEGQNLSRTETEVKRMRCS